MGNCVSLQQEGEEPDVQQVQDTSVSAKRLRASASSAYLRQSSRDGVNLLLRPSPSATSLRAHSVRSTRGALNAEVKARRASATPTSSAPSQTLTNQFSTPASCRRSSLPLSPEGSPAYHPLAPSPTAPNPTYPSTARTSTHTSSTLMHKSMRDSAVSVSAPHTPPLPTSPSYPVRGTPPSPAPPTYRVPSTRKPVSHTFTLPSPYDSPTAQQQQQQQQQQQGVRGLNSTPCDPNTCIPDVEDRVVVADPPLLPSNGTGSTSMPSSPFALAQRSMQFADMDAIHDSMIHAPTQPAGASPKAISSPSNLTSIGKQVSGDAHLKQLHSTPVVTGVVSPAAAGATQQHDGWLAHKSAQQEAANNKQAELEWSDSAGPYSCPGAGFNGRVSLPHTTVGDGGVDECAKGSGRVVGLVPGCADAEAEWFLGVGGKAQCVSEQWKSEQWQHVKCDEQGRMVMPQYEEGQWQPTGSERGSGLQMHKGSGCLGSQRGSWALPHPGLCSSSNAPGMSARHTSAYSYHASIRASSRDTGGLSVPEAMPSADWQSMHMAMAVAVELGEAVPMSPEGLAHAGSKEERRSTGHSSGTVPYAPLFTAGGPGLKRIASTGSSAHRASSLASDVRLSSCGTGLRLSRNASSSRTTPSGPGSSRPSPNTLAMASGVRVSPSSNSSAAAADAVAALTDAFTGRKSGRAHADSTPEARASPTLPQQPPATYAPQTNPAHLETLPSIPPINTNTTPQALNNHNNRATPDHPNKLAQHAPLQTQQQLQQQQQHTPLLPHHTPLPALMPVSESPHSLEPSDNSITSMTNNISGSNGGACALSGNRTSNTQLHITHAHAALSHGPHTTHAAHAHAADGHTPNAHAVCKARVSKVPVSKEFILPRLDPQGPTYDSRAARMAACAQAHAPRISQNSSLETPSASSPVSLLQADPNTPASFANPPWSPQPHMCMQTHMRARKNARAREEDKEAVKPGEPGCTGGFSPVSESIRVFDDSIQLQARLPRALTVRTPNNNSHNHHNNKNKSSAPRVGEQQHSSAQPGEQQQQQQQQQRRAFVLRAPTTTTTNSSSSALHAGQPQHTSAPTWEEFQQQQQQQHNLTRSATCARSSAPTELSPFGHLGAAAYARVHSSKNGSPHTQAHVTGGVGRDPATLLANGQCASALVGLLPHTQHPLPPFVRYLNNGGGRSSAAAVQGVSTQAADVASPQKQLGCSPHAQVRGPVASASARDEHEMLALQGFFSPRSPGRASLSPTNGGLQRQPGAGI